MLHGKCVTAFALSKFSITSSSYFFFIIMFFVYHYKRNEKETYNRNQPNKKPKISKILKENKISCKRKNT